MARADAAAASEVSASQMLLSMDDFKHFKQIGKGKDCIVYSASCEKLGGATVVLKVYDKSKISAIKQRSVRREARIMRYLTEKGIPHTTAYTGAFQDSKQIYIVMEHCSRGDLLEQLLKEGRAMAEKRVVREVVLPSLTALAYLHAAGIIHRDIKLENLFISNSGHLQLGDFGLAISVLEERPISPVGTLEYMAPEILRLPPTDSVVRGLVRVEDIEPIDEKVDIWSFGVTVYELVTGRSPFEGASKDEVKAAILSHQMRPLPSFLTAGCQDFILKSLQTEAGQRPGALALLNHPWVQTHCSTADLLIVAKLPTQLPRRPMGYRHQQQLLQQAREAEEAGTAAAAASSNSSSSTTTAAPAAAAEQQAGSVPVRPAAAAAAAKTSELPSAAAGAADGSKLLQHVSIPSALGSPQIPAHYVQSAAGSSPAPQASGNGSSANASAAMPPVHNLPNSNSTGSSSSSSATSLAPSMADSAASIHHHHHSSLGVGSLDQGGSGAKSAAAASAKKLACQEPIIERPADKSAAAAALSGGGSKQQQQQQQQEVSKQQLKDITRVEVLPVTTSSTGSKGGSKKQQQQQGGKKLFNLQMFKCLAAAGGSE